MRVRLFTLHFISLLAITFAIGTAHAKSLRTKAQCSDKDFRSQLPPIRNQYSSGLCRAFVLSDLIYFKTKQNLSPIGLALAYDKAGFETTDALYEGKDPRRFQALMVPETGFVYDVLNAAKSEGVCLDKAFGQSTRNAGLPSARGATPPGDEYLLLKKVDEIADLKTAEDKLRALEDLFGKAQCTATNNAVYSQFGADFVEVVKKAVLEKKKGARALHELFDSLCKPEGIRPNIDVTTHHYFKTEIEKLDLLDEQLNNDNIAALSYTAAIFSGTKNPEFSPHISTVAGRRFHKGKCEYLIRNSWGGDCAFYDPSFKCEGGYVWLSDETIMKHAHQVTTYR